MRLINDAFPRSSVKARRAGVYSVNGSAGDARGHCAAGERATRPADLIRVVQQDGLLGGGGGGVGSRDQLTFAE